MSKFLLTVCAFGLLAKDSDAEEVISRRRKTTSERSQRRERDQFP
jgi:hypothetical protein